MTSKELNLTLLGFLPELKSVYLEETSWQEGDDTGSHVVFSDVFYPYIAEILKDNHSAMIHKCFFAIERMIELNDEYAEEVLELSLFENFFYQDNLQINVRQYMGEKTKNKYDKYINKTAKAEAFHREKIT